MCIVHILCVAYSIKMLVVPYECVCMFVTNSNPFGVPNKFTKPTVFRFEKRQNVKLMWIYAMAINVDGFACTKFFSFYSSRHLFPYVYMKWNTIVICCSFCMQFLLLFRYVFIVNFLLVFFFNVFSLQIFICTWKICLLRIN